jgi:hypothetical protein
VTSRSGKRQKSFKYFMHFCDLCFDITNRRIFVGKLCFQ